MTDETPITVRLSEWHFLQDSNRLAFERIAELEEALGAILAIYENKQLEDAEAMDEIGKISRKALNK